VNVRAIDNKISITDGIYRAYVPIEALGGLGTDTLTVDLTNQAFAVFNIAKAQSLVEITATVGCT
jgi:hypothetical protein